MLAQSIGGAEVTLAAYDVFRNSGTYASGDPSGRENIANAYLGVALNVLGTMVEPSIEGRHWLQNVLASTAAGGATGDRTAHSYLGTAAIRTRLGMGRLAAYPSVGYTFGQLATVTSNSTPTHADFTGFKGQIAIRIAP